MSLQLFSEPCLVRVIYNIQYIINDITISLEFEFPYVFQSADFIIGFHQAWNRPFCSPGKHTSDSHCRPWGKGHRQDIPSGNPGKHWAWHRHSTAGIPERHPQFPLMARTRICHLQREDRKTRDGMFPKTWCSQSNSPTRDFGGWETHPEKLKRSIPSPPALSQDEIKNIETGTNSAESSTLQKEKLIKLFISPLFCNSSIGLTNISGRMWWNNRPGASFSLF